MRFKKQYFGTLSDGKKTSLFIVSTKDMTLSVTDFGCTVTGLVLKNRNGSETDIVLGFSTLTGYAENWGSFGAVIGRYSNKIRGASFSLNGKEYKLFDNCNGACLHGGFPRWENEVWNGSFIKKDGAFGVRFTNTFPDGYQGFPGNLSVEVEYLIDDENQLVMSYSARTDKETPVSITNHSYFNLSGCGSIKDNELKLYCEEVLETDETNMPTGKFLAVKNTVYDFLQFKKIGADFDKMKNGYDDCFVTGAYRKETGVPGRGTPLVRVAELVDRKALKKMTLFSNSEGIQLYTANYVKHLPGKYGAFYMPFNAVCLETQNFPDSPNRSEFPSAVLRPDEEYHSISKYKFEDMI